ncbi:hypothetical protein BZA05DRAFT_337725 [Tricharina praecox]|uniref:uncharacterized protein n=1 Tax=Tricharina praecox TaxID=43433 RepID=UPI002220EF7D|nr:uncharacterized protein BZA05DRAFT_337725 [Tricharina praecox]KAI5851819.1 hypothetical protein BZA05DRAFT_337725 [Tricharina praecox]
MVVSIRIPPESPSSLLPQYAYRTSSRPLTPRGYRRLLPLLLAFIFVVETYRLFHTPSSNSTPISADPSPSLDTDLDLPPAPVGLSHLIIVACHAIWIPGPTLGSSASEWVLEPYQLSLTPPASSTFLAHISRGASLAVADPSSLLVFSGGETRPSAGPRTEAAGYFELAAQRGWVGEQLQARTTTETQALDSYQNLVFSLLRFREVTGGWPERVTVVSYEFKRRRFVDLHRAAIGWPGARFEFVGVDPEWTGVEGERERELVEQGEWRNARRLWERDPYACGIGGEEEEGGVRGGELREKRRGRNAGRRRGYVLDGVDASVKRLLGWCSEGGSEGRMFDERLPWTEVEE